MITKNTCKNKYIYYSKHEQQITAPTPDTLIPWHMFLNFGKCFLVPHHHVHGFLDGYQKVKNIFWRKLELCAVFWVHIGGILMFYNL